VTKAPDPAERACHREQLKSSLTPPIVIAYTGVHNEAELAALAARIDVIKTGRDN
jgi:hypothetical protein